MVEGRAEVGLPGLISDLAGYLAIERSRSPTVRAARGSGSELN